MPVPAGFFAVDKSIANVHKLLHVTKNSYKVLYLKYVHDEFRCLCSYKMAFVYAASNERYYYKL